MKYRTIQKLTGAALGALALTAALALSACSGDSSSPTDPGVTNAGLQLASAEVQANGEEYQAGSGGTFHHEHDGAQGGSTLFEATLTRDGAPATGPEVEVHYETPMGHGGGMMDGGTGSFHLYDDGTHGDPTPGDGVYHYEDHEGRYGFHHQEAGHGDYHYDFFGLHEDGSETNHMMIDVTVEHD